MAIKDEEAEALREVVGVFSDADTLQEAIDELTTSGFGEAEITLLAAERAVVEKLGHKYKKIEDLEDDPAAPLADYYVPVEAVGQAKGALMGGLMYLGAFAGAGAVLASGGALASAIAGAILAGGGGGLIGAVLGESIDELRVRYFDEQLAHGGLLLWVRAWDAEREKRAVEILRKHSGRDVHAHTLPAAA